MISALTGRAKNVTPWEKFYTYVWNCIAYIYQIYIIYRRI